MKKNIDKKFEEQIHKDLLDEIKNLEFRVLKIEEILGKMVRFYGRRNNKTI